MAEHQRKIDLQSQADLRYLLDNIRTAAQQKIDRDFPASTDQTDDDDFRNKIHGLVEQYIQQTLALALPSLSINGLDAAPSVLTSDMDDSASSNDMNFEPYDTRLAQKVRDLYASLEEETTKVAGLRREAPKKTLNNYMEALAKDMQTSEQEFETRRAEIAAQPLPDLGTVTVTFAGAGAGASIQESWNQTRKDLEELRNVTKVKADLERAIRAAEEVQKR